MIGMAIILKSVMEGDTVTNSGSVSNCYTATDFFDCWLS